MVPDFIDNVILSRVSISKEDWVRQAWEKMVAKGATFARASFQIEKPDILWLEGWIIRPIDQGLSPWERPTVRIEPKDGGNV